MWTRWAVLAPLLACACAAPSRLTRTGPAPVPLVRQAIDPGQADAVFGRAVRVLERRGYAFLLCDPERGAMDTERLEKDAPCGATSCLARQIVTVKLGWRSVRLAVVRQVFDGGFRAWIPAEDQVSRSAVAQEEEALLRDLLEADLEGARPAAAAEPGGPCQRAARCQAGQCSVALQALVR